MKMTNNFKPKRPFNIYHIINYFESTFKLQIDNIISKHKFDCITKDNLVLEVDDKGYSDSYFSLSVNFYGNYCASDIIAKFNHLISFVSTNLDILNIVQTDDDSYPVKTLFYGCSKITYEDEKSNDSSYTFYVIFDIKEHLKHLFIETN